MPRFYYGWLQVLIAAAAMTATFPGRTYGLGLIKEPLRNELQIGDLRFSWLNFFAIILGATLVLPVGRLIDRLGCRVVLPGVVLLLSASVAWMSYVHDETAFFIALTLVRGFGQGALSVVAIALVGKWFRKRISLAMGLFTILLGIGFVIPPFVIKPMVDGHSWRYAWMFVAYVLIGFAILAGLFTRSSPESYAIQPDEPAEEVTTQSGSTLWETLKTPAFWAYTAAGALLNLVISAITIDNELLLKERAIHGERIEETILGVMFICGLPANLLTGWLARFVALPKLLVLGSFLLAGSLAMFPFLNSLPSAIAYAGMLGASGGIVTVVYFAIYGHYFGRKHLGLIQATAQVCATLASAIGPVLLSACRESNGRTDTFFLATAVMAVSLGILCWIIRPTSRGVING